MSLVFYRRRPSCYRAPIVSGRGHKLKGFVQRNPFGSGYTECSERTSTCSHANPKSRSGKHRLVFERGNRYFCLKTMETTRAWCLNLGTQCSLTASQSVWTRCYLCCCRCYQVYFHKWIMRWGEADMQTQHWDKGAAWCVMRDAMRKSFNNWLCVLMSFDSNEWSLSGFHRAW